MKVSYVLVIGGGKDTPFLLQQIKLLGYKTIVVDQNPSAPAVDIADVYLCLSAWDSIPILNEIKGRKIIACLTRSSGAAVLCWAEVNQALGYPTPDSKTVEELSGKLSLHKACLNMNVATPATEIFEIWEDVLNIQLPLVFKPEWEKVGKAGVVLVKHAENIKDAVAHSRKYLAKGSVLVQEYLNGKDLTILGVCLNDSYFPYALLEEKNSFNDSEYVSHTGFNEISNNPAAVGMIEVATLICKEKKLETTDCIMFGLGGKQYKEYNRGSDVNRVCISELVGQKINEA
jgi:biotin carboxylase